MADPNACGHATTTPGCGGCDPGAIEFVRDDYGPWRRVAGGALDEEALGRPFTDQEEAQYALGRKHEWETQRPVRDALHEVLSKFTEQGHPGRPCLRTGWQTVERVNAWREQAGSASAPACICPADICLEDDGCWLCASLDPELPCPNEILYDGDVTP